MPGDYSRFTFDATKHYSRVLLQQGRVTLDSDANEETEILTRRDRVTTNDIVGDVAVPRATTPNAFKITASGLDLSIGGGRIYVDGIVAEAFPGEAPLTYAKQPFFPDPPALPFGLSLVYLDVWDRELTAVQQPDLLEPALHGIDTTTRTQTIWQVKVLQRQGLTCGIDLDTIFPPSPARLTVHVDPPGNEPDPCVLPEAGGFRDVENHFYRVEVHGNFTPPKFKFYRDPISARIEELKVGTTATQTILKVDRTGRDSVLRFSPGDRVEVLRERNVLREEPGVMAVILKVDDAAQEITIDKAIPPAGPKPDPHAWITRWDQDNPSDPDHLLVASGGLIPLESGISVELTGVPHPGDYWVFPARVATPNDIPLVNAPPAGVLHHYAPLALINLFNPATLKASVGGVVSQTTLTVLSDCRTLWPPDCDCECAACVNPEDHGSGKFTIQMAIDKVTREGGGKVCLEPGLYQFEAPLTIQSATSVWLTGHGDCNLLFTGSGPFALLITESNDVVVENLSIRRFLDQQAEATIITVLTSMYGLVVRHCTLAMPLAAGITLPFDPIGIGFGGLVRDAKVLDCRITAPVGIGPVTDPQTKKPSLTVATDIEIRGNTILSTAGAIRFLAPNIVAVSIRQNVIGTDQSGIRVEGTTWSLRSNTIDSNSIFTRRSGIGVGADRTTVTNNLVRGVFTLVPNSETLVNADPTFSSIAVYTESPTDIRSDCLVSGNRCSNTRGYGVLVADPVSGLVVSHNFIRHTAGGGIVGIDKARGSDLKIEGNDVREVALGDDISKRWYCICPPPFSEVDVLANTINGVGLPPMKARPIFPANGIRAAVPRRFRAHENDIDGVASAMESRKPADPATGFPASVSFASAAIEVVPPFGSVEITNNIIHTSGFVLGQPGASQTRGHTYAIHVEAPPALDFTVVTLSTQTTAALVSPQPPPRGLTFSQFVVVFPGFWWVRLGPATSLLLIRANTLTCDGDVDFTLGMVRVDDPLVRCTFGGNICAQRPDLEQSLTFGVSLTAETIVADSNQIFGRFGQAALRIADVLHLDLWTVLGNIVQREILVHSDTTPLPLPDPWRSLNRITF